MLKVIYQTATLGATALPLGLCSPYSDVSSCVVYRHCILLVEQIVAKQTNINANVLRKVGVLEKLLHTKLIDHHHQHQAQHQQHWSLSKSQPSEDGQRMHDDAPLSRVASADRM